MLYCLSCALIQDTLYCLGFIVLVLASAFDMVVIAFNEQIDTHKLNHNQITLED